ncbi:MAG: hypothetical protein N2690_00210 [Rhodocyclaceae bacterium]|nr:hypothetical protein [Rhodocyclaceae bacterium]
MNIVSDYIGVWILKGLVHVVLVFAKSAVYISLICVLVYMFAGWIKAMLGVAFSSIGVLLLPLDRGRFLSGVAFYVAGAIATYAFSLAVGIIVLAMFAAGADVMVQASIAAQGSGASRSSVAMYSLGFALAVMLLAILIMLVVVNAKHWGVEYFGTRAFDMGMKAPRGIGLRLPRGWPDSRSPQTASGSQGGGDTGGRDDINSPGGGAATRGKTAGGVMTLSSPSGGGGAAQR